MIMKVLRACLGLDLADAKTELRRVLSGDYSGTLPEMELLAERLRAAGVAVEATRS